ncbi:MAG: hypothetical protein KBS81_08720, partial [Spirochaetales bacterium]|nr:hypothetical protein [Candidatus Physcosoma equi]
YGGDALVGDLKAFYTVLGKCSLGAELFLMLHGSKGFDSLFETGTAPTLLSGDITFSSYSELSGEYWLNDRLKVFGQYDFAVCKGKTDHQLVLGVETVF